MPHEFCFKVVGLGDQRSIYQVLEVRLLPDEVHIGANQGVEPVDRFGPE
jgi:hypothetical protein